MNSGATAYGERSRRHWEQSSTSWESHLSPLLPKKIAFVAMFQKILLPWKKQSTIAVEKEKKTQLSRAGRWTSP